MFRLKPIRHYQACEKNIENIFYNCILGLRSQHSQAKNIFLLMVQQPLVGQASSVWRFHCHIKIQHTR